MANFKIAFKTTILDNEGGYNPGIDEKETYMGIDRGANPGWSGWEVIDSIKKNNPSPTIGKIDLILSQNLNLQAGIEKFYKANYWDTVSLDQVNDQQLAGNLFDCAVNQGEGLARKFMQAACNYVIKTNKLAIRLLIVDRQLGPATINTFNQLPPALLNAEINAERKASYSIDSGYAEWGNVWEKRLKQYYTP